jgi:hypothetical protein
MKLFPNARWLLALLLILVWFNSGIESFRNGDLGDIPEHHEKLFSPPWLPFRAYASRNGEEKLYWNYANLILGKPYDLDYLAQKRQGDHETNKKILSQMISLEGPRLIYRDFPFEYPPVAAVPILLPRMFADNLPGYRLAYGMMAAIMILASGWAVGQIASRSRRESSWEWRDFTLLVLALGPIQMTSYDIVPALLTIAAFYFLSRSKAVASGILLGTAILLKLYPVFLLALWCGMLVLQKPKPQWRTAFRLLISCVLTAAVISVPFLWLVPKEFIQALFLYGNRPFEIESIPGALLVLKGGKEAIFGSFGSFNAQSPALLLSAWGLLLPLCVIGILFKASTQSHLQENGQESWQENWTPRASAWTLCLLLIILIMAKVLSPQYLIWLLPWAALSSDRSLRRWILAAAAITQIFYPFLFDFFSEQGNRWIALMVVLRNTALLIAAYKAFRVARTSGSKSERSRSRPPCPVMLSISSKILSYFG